MNVPGIGNAFESKLMAWRQKKDANFRFNPAIGVPKQELHKLDVKMLGIRQKLESELRDGPQALSALGIAAASKAHQTRSLISTLVQQKSKAMADLTLVPKS